MQGMRDATPEPPKKTYHFPPPDGTGATVGQPGETLQQVLLRIADEGDLPLGQELPVEMRVSLRIDAVET